MISIPYLICSILSFVPAIVCHEACHGFAAYKLGDPTAKRAGRLSFNPLKHIDPFGTVIMPLLLMAMNMPVFGYAKPVPYNPAYFKDPRKGDLIVGLAGPAANLVLAVLGAVVYTLVMLVLPVSALAQNDVFYYFLTLFLPMFSLINLYLMFFNLLPIPPLDGSRILLVALPQRIYFQIMRYERVIFVILLAAVWAGVLDGVLGTFNDVVWDLLDLGTGYIDQIAYSAYYAAIGTVI